MRKFWAKLIPILIKFYQFLGWLPKKKAEPEPADEIDPESILEWLSLEKVVEVRGNKARVCTLIYPEGKVGMVFPKIKFGEWVEVKDEKN